MISILLLSRCAAPPYPAAPDFLHGKACHTILRSLCSLTNRVPLPPLCRGQNKTPRNTFFIRGSTVSTGCCAPLKRGKGGGASHQRGMHFLASAAILYNSRGREPSTRPGGVSRSRTEPWQPRAERPGGWLNPHARKGVSTFGNTGKHRPSPDPDRAERRLPSIFFSKGVHHESGRNYELTYPLRQHHHSA